MPGSGIHGLPGVECKVCQGVKWKACQDVECMVS